MTRLFPLLLAACVTAATAVAAPPATAATADATAPATYRLDLFHTGGKGIEIFAVERLRLEPLPWPGHPARLSDDGQAGLYRYEVRDAAGTLLRAQGYASVAGEWLTTDEAQKSYRTFTESLRFPAPTAKGPVQVRILKRDAKQVFQSLFETAVDTTDMFVDRTPAAEQTLVHLEVHGAPADKVDLLLIGDGYTAGECSAKFPGDAQRMMAALFREQPFARRRNDFNVWGLCPPSAESGISRPSTGVQHKTPVGATYDAFGSERYVLTFDDRALREVASRAPYEAIVILANGNTYGGGGIFNDFSTVAVDSAWAEYIFVHELGHHFAALADEYYTSPVAYAPVTEVVEPWEPNVTALLERDRLKWRHLVERSTPVPTPWPKAKFEEFSRDIQQRRKQIREDRRPESDMDALFREEQAWLTRLFARTAHRNAVGAFQGAYYDAQAYYRPQLDCIMFTRDDVPFCKVCEAALEHVIDSIAGKSPQP